MTIQEWMTACAAYLVGVGGMEAQDAAYEAQLEAQAQAGRFGDEAALWQSPEAAAAEILHEVNNAGPVSFTGWLAEQEEALAAQADSEQREPEPGEPLNLPRADEE